MPVITDDEALRLFEEAERFEEEAGRLAYDILEIKGMVREKAKAAGIEDLMKKIKAKRGEQDIALGEAKKLRRWAKARQTDPVQKEIPA